MKSSFLVRFPQTYKTIKWRAHLIRKLFRTMGVRPQHIFVPILFSLAITTLDVASIGLLAPLARGIAAGNFDFIGHYTGIKRFIMMVPGLISGAGIGSTFFSIVVAIFCLRVLKLGVVFIQNLYRSYYTTLFHFRIHTFVYNRFFGFGKLFFDVTSQGRMRQILDYAGQAVTLLWTCQGMIFSVFCLVAHLILMMIISLPLAVTTLLLFPFLHVSSNALIRRIERNAKVQTSLSIKKSKETYNMFSAMPLVWGYSKEDDMKKRYQAMSNEVCLLQFRSSILDTSISIIQEFIILLGLLALAYVIVVFLAKDQPANLAMYAVFIFVAQRTLPMFKIFTTFKTQIAQVKSPLREVVSILEDDDKHIVCSGDRHFSGLSKGIELKNHTFAYGSNPPVLKDVNLYFTKGKATALVGPSGAGKTTIINLLMRYYDCNAGTLFVDGVDIREFSLSSLRGHYALVSQETYLLNDTFYNNVVFGLSEVDDDAVDVALKRARLADLVRRLPEGMQTLIGDRGVRLSGGEKQRVAIARAFLKGSEILFLDEATSSLDSETEKLIQEALNDIIHERTAIIIAHRLSTIQNVDRIVYLQEGSVLEEGTLQELLELRGKFYNQWIAQKFYE